jgi:hypothetical protein
VCHACAQHADCGAGAACLPDGSCGTDATVAYVAMTGNDAGNCTQSAPCQTITGALAKMRPFVKIDGSGPIVDNVTINRTVTILADPGAMLTRKTTGDMIAVGGAGIAVEIDDLTISDGFANGVSFAQGDRLTLQRVTIANNLGIGVSANNVHVDVLRSTIDANHGGGLSLVSSSFTIENNFIYANGGSTSNFGGVSVVYLPATGSQILDFNTITQNQGPVGVNTGVSCAMLNTPPTFSNDIIYGNFIAGSASQVSAGCLYAYCDIGPNVTVGSTSIDADPMFVSSTNFHIMPSSPAKDTADPNATLMNDIDGDHRPVNNRRDMGADESP